MCGEHITGNADDAVKAGSSPHVRGAHLGQNKKLGHAGIIPACAGSTQRRPCLPMVEWDHPRMCGEHRHCPHTLNGEEGSSPHVRGAQDHGGRCEHGSGIIPACAGSTLPLTRLRTQFWDHPRMCGEHCGRNNRNHRRRGSSPHVRGAHVERCGA